MKNVLFTIVALLLPEVIMATGDYEAYGTKIGSIYYELNSSNKTASVTCKYYDEEYTRLVSCKNDYIGAIVIPQEVTHENIVYSVTSIGKYAFYGCSGITSIIIPNSVTTIDYQAFYRCSVLTSINIPNSVTTINYQAFYDCSGLTSITIPNSVSSIGANAFSGCSGLTTIVSEIENPFEIGTTNVFDSNTNTKATLIVPKGKRSVYLSTAGWKKFTNILEVGQFEFEVNGIRYLTGENNTVSVTSKNTKYFGDVVIPSQVTYNSKTYSVTSIGISAFYDCNSLTSVTIPNSVTSIDRLAFACCKGLTSVTIPNGVTSIGIDAFWNCIYLTSVTIPKSVTNIAEWSFCDCSSLKSVHITDLEAWCRIEFSNAESNPLYWAGHLFLNGTEISELVIPNSVTSIGNWAFNNCSSLTSITIPNSVTSIGNAAFSNCIGLTSVSIPNSVTHIGNAAFRNCFGLTSVTIPNRVTSIGYMTFHNCSGLNSVTIPYSVTSIGDYAFDYCNNLTEVYCLAEQVPDTKSNSFSTNIGNATLHVPATSINAYKNASPWNQFKAIVPTGNTLFKLIYKVDDVEYKTYDVEYGTTITPEPAPTKEGCTFSGWSEIPEKMPAKDVTVTGSFTINKYKLTYKVDDVEYKTYDVEYSSAITPEPAPAKEGCKFSGWSEIPEKMPAKDVTVTGSFTINKYKLTYKVDDVEYKTYDVEYGTSITPEPAPTKEGYTFSGWSEIPEKMPAKDVTVLGSFTINKYKLNYKVDDVEYKAYDVEYGTSITPEPVPTKEGYTFSGWSEIPEKMPAKDVTVLGSFSKGAYKLTYMVDGKVYKTINYDYGATITPEAEPTKDGYTFSGWSSIPETMPAKDVTVTGSFSKGAYKLTYMVDGKVYKTISYDYGATITPEAKPTKEGYTFSGWSEIPSTMPAKDVTVTGTFTINKYKLVYIVDGVEYKSYDVEYGAKITPEAEPTKEGYTFSGWSSIPETMPAKDVTITGTFTINKYKLNYLVDGEKYKSFELDYGTTITPEPAPTKEGYTFSGWSEIPEKMPAKDVTIVGTFSKLKYKLTYIVDGEIYKSYEIKPGSTIIPEVEPTKEGFTFSGWSEIPEEMPAKDVTVTGTFTKDIKKGDINGDNTVNGKDIDEIVNYLMGKPSNSFDIKAADVNGDEKVNAADIVTIVKIIKGNQ